MALAGLDDPQRHADSYLTDLMLTFPQITPWNLGDLSVRHYLALCAVVDARRNEK